MSSALDPKAFDNHVVAVVGNRESQPDSNEGAEIDGCNLIVRFNWAVPTPETQAGTGSKCHYMISAVSIAKRARRSGQIGRFFEQFPEGQTL